MAGSSNRHTRKTFEPEDGQRSIFYGSPKFDRPFYATYDKKSRSWRRDRDL